MTCDTYSKFPGLTVCTTIYTGVKTLVAYKGGHRVPYYSMNLIGQTQKASGLPPIVWIFHQLMGTMGHETHKDDFVSRMEPTGPVKSTISIIENEKDGTLSFHLDAQIQIRIEFPAMLLRILPTSRKRAEKQGSAAVMKTINKASKKGMEAAHQSFLEFQKRTKKHRHSFSAS